MALGRRTSTIGAEGGGGGFGRRSLKGFRNPPLLQEALYEREAFQERIRSQTLQPIVFSLCDQRCDGFAVCVLVHVVA